MRSKYILLIIILVFPAPYTWAVDVTVNTQNVTGSISPYLTGTNFGSYEDTDYRMANYSIADKLIGIKAFGPVRYPGGSETSHVHWEEPGILKWKDGWETDAASSYYCPPSERNHTEYMDVNEYLSWCDHIGMEPTLGVNLESGWRYDRMQDSYDEAIRLMRHVAGAGYDVKYWYIDNEPFFMTGLEHAAYVNEIVPLMKAEKPDIKIICNPGSRISEESWAWENRVMPFLLAAGHNVDFVDVHWYWNWSDDNNYANWQAFLNQNPLRAGKKGQVGLPYNEEIEIFKNWCSNNNLSHIELVSLEWNVGKSTATDWSAYKISLVQTEMMMQFMKGGLPIATIWPRYNSPQTPNVRGVFDNEGNFRPAYNVLTLFSNSLGENVVTAISSESDVPVLSVVKSDGSGAFIYILSKRANDEPCTIAIDAGIETATAVVHTTNDINGDSYSTDPVALTVSGESDIIDFILPSYSMVMVTVEFSEMLNSPPVFTDDPIRTVIAVENEAYGDSIAVYASDDNPGDTLTFSKVSGPDWLNFSGNGIISGRPTSTDLSLNSFIVRVNDNNGGSDTTTLEISVYQIGLNQILLAGWDAFSSDGSSHAATQVDSGLSLTTSLSYNFTEDASIDAGSNDGTFGTYGSGANTGLDGTDISSIRFADNGSITINVTNNESFEIDIEKFHFDVFREWNNCYGKDITIDTSGDISIWSSGIIWPTNQVQTLNDNDLVDFEDKDVDLSGLADHTLAAGESATITMTTEQGTFSGAHYDNIGISASFRTYSRSDLNKDGAVDLNDLSLITSQWLGVPDVPSADIAPLPFGDDEVNLEDFAQFAENWQSSW